MALAAPAKTVDISGALAALQPLGTDEYFVAFGEGSRQFCGTPNGYSASQVPTQVVQDLLSGTVNRVVWASFGDNPSSWFFLYEKKDRLHQFRAGKAIPSPLRRFLAGFTSSDIVSSFRVQLGKNGSFMAWSNTHWMYRSLPKSLEGIVNDFGCTQHKNSGVNSGTFKHGPFEIFTWHDDGSFYIQAGSIHRWSLRPGTMEDAWNVLWQSDSQHPVTQKVMTELALAAIDSHSAYGNEFVFIKKQKPGQEADFALRFGFEDTISRVSSSPLKDIEISSASEQVPKAYDWAVSKHCGKPHPSEGWELTLKKDEKLKVLRRLERDWYIVENLLGHKGWAHGSWLRFSMSTEPRKPRKNVDPREAYKQFVTETAKIWDSPGTLRSFPDLSHFQSACAEGGCKPLRQGPAAFGICAHDLDQLLRGSGAFNRELLKDERNKWHPDKFARFCHPSYMETLKKKAENFFVMFGLILDHLDEKDTEKEGGIGA